ncbi:hypothetical protein V5799_014216 [Amblyomma americanum]|uniref:Uncharacterized protein n=1 Tax=Amblyomma americanum TaxID=6943 RepID=A0AAQ4E3P1_AMBAM
MKWPEETKPPVGGVDALYVVLDHLAINWNPNFLFAVRVLELPRHAASATGDSAVALILSRGKLSSVWQEGVCKSVDQTQYESYVQMHYELLSVTKSNVSATTLRELVEAILAAKIDIVADECEQELNNNGWVVGTAQGFVSNLLSASYRALRAQLSQFADAYGRRMFSSDRHASYVYIANRADVALGSIGPPLYYLNDTVAVNYAGLGAIVAEPLARSFGLHGIGMDSMGANKRWWYQTGYFDRAQCEIINVEGNHSAYRMVHVGDSV